MAKQLEFQLMSEEAKPELSPLAAFHTGTLKKFLDIVRVSADRYYKIIHNNQVVITGYYPVKAILAIREHIPNKAERKLARQQKAHDRN